MGGINRGPFIHELKTWPQYFAEIYCSLKMFEVRKSDRDFKVGDLLVLREYDPVIQEYTGRIIPVCITYILPGGQFGIEGGYCVMGLSNIIPEDLYWSYRNMFFGHSNPL